MSSERKTKEIRVIRLDVEKGFAEFESYIAVKEFEDNAGKKKVRAYIPIPKELIDLLDLAHGLQVKVRIEISK